jgi:K+-sensing histidine kinase KdpD
MSAYFDLYLYALKFGIAPLLSIEIISVLIGLAAGLAFKLSPRQAAILCLAFGAIGAVTGLFMGASRDSVVGTIVPAFLTVVSGLAAYQFAAPGKVYETWRKSLPVAIACMFLAAAAGATFGSAMRNQQEEAVRRYEEWKLRYEQVELPIEAEQWRQKLGLPSKAVSEKKSD